MNGSACAIVHGPTACDVFDAWMDLVVRGVSGNDNCFRGANATACFSPSGVLQSFHGFGGKIALQFDGVIEASPPPSSVVYPAFLCKCGSASPGKASPVIQSAAVLPNSFMALSNDLNVFFVDLGRDRATAWNQRDQPIGVRCSTENSSAYVIALDSSCVSILENGVSCPDSHTLNPCVHVDAFRAFAQKPIGKGEQCLSASTRAGTATLCLSSPTSFINYTIASHVYDFQGGIVANMQAPDSVYPFVPADDCPCQK